MEEQRMPHFCKLLVGDFARRLDIPRNFIKHIAKEARANSDTSKAAATKVTLENSNGRIWIVELEETVDGMFLTIGWPKFVEDHFLKEHEFLVFRYDGSMHFMVLVFGMTACERATQVKSSRTCTRAAEDQPEPRKLPFDMSPSRKNESSGNKLTETSTYDNYTVNQLRVQIPDQSEVQKSTSRGGSIISGSSLDLHEVGGSGEGLEADPSLRASPEDEKTKAIEQIMRRLRTDKVAVDSFCSTLSLYKWNVDAAAQDIGVSRGKQQKRSQEGLKQKFLVQLAFVKRQLRHFFPPDDDSPAPEPPEMSKRRKMRHEKKPNSSEQ